MSPSQIHLTPDWHRIELSAEDHDHLARSAPMVQAGAQDDIAAVRQRISFIWSGLSERLRRQVRKLADGSSRRPELYVTGLPVIDSLPPTPTSGVSTAASPGYLSEFLMLAFCQGLGTPISYRDQRGGSIFHDIFPTEANANEISSQSSASSLGFHTEMFFHPEPPDFLLLHCLRPDPAELALTSVASLADMDARLSRYERRVLRQEVFAIDLARLHGSYVREGVGISELDPRPVISLARSGLCTGQFRFEPELTTPLTQVAHAVMEQANARAEEVAATSRLESGAMLIVDNRRAAHSRSTFPASFDGNDRWLRRMMIAARTNPGLAVERRDDLELARAWSSRGARFHHVEREQTPEAFL